MDDYVPSTPPTMPQPTAPPANSFSFLRVMALLALVLLAARWLLPPLAEEIEYSLTLGQQRAEAEVARDELKHVKFQDMDRTFQLVAKSVNPCVVGVTTQSDSLTADDEWSLLTGRRRQQHTRGDGSGVIIDKAGYILTNNHVVAGAQQIQVLFSDGRIVDAEVLGVDPPTDLAVLRVEPGHVVAAQWGDSDKLQVGSPVLAIGNPFRLTQTVTFGIISAKDRRGLPGASPYLNFLQTDAAVNPGNSGGPLVDLSGKVVGINTAIIGRGYQGISFSIPSNLAREVYERLKKEGKVSRGWLGVGLEDTPNDESSRQRPVQGAVVSSVAPNGPAAEAGIEEKDVIVGWNDQVIDSSMTLRLAVANTPIGSQATCRLLRGNEKLTTKVKVIERPTE